MKRIFLVLLTCLLLCSCSGKEITPQLKGISFTAEMTYYNEVYKFDGELLSNGGLVAEITFPAELEGLKMTLGEEGTKVEYKGLSYSPIEGSMPFSAVMEDFYAPIRHINEGGLAADGDGSLTCGKDAEAFTLTVSPTGLPQKLELPDERFSVTFYNISVNEDVND